MAVITADQIDYSETEEGVGFFSLKNDGDEAIVRIMCDSMDDLEIMTVHPVTIGNSSFPNRQVNCLRNPREPLENCPLCAAGEQVKQKVFIKMIQYDPETRKPRAVVWDRVASIFAPKLKSFLDNYGPLSHIMCKIIRHGSGRKTTYDIVPNINPTIFNEQNFPIMEGAFDNFSVLGRMVMDKNAEEILEFIRTGSFPEKANNDTVRFNNQQPSYNQSDYGRVRDGYQPSNQEVFTNNTYQQPINTASNDYNQSITNEGFGGTPPFNNNQVMDRPKRY